MGNDLEKAQDIFLNHINKICGKFGLNNIMAQLYAVLYLSAQPLSLDDMVTRLKISKGSASTNIRALERYGAVRRVWVKGSRKDYYEAELDITKIILDRIRSMTQNRLSEVNEMIVSSDRVLGSVVAQKKEESKEMEVFKQRLEKLKELHARASTLFQLFNSSVGTMLISGKAQEADLLEGVLDEIKK